jgi:D-xylose transport system permease protein
VLNDDRGVPLAVLILIGVVIVVDFITRRTAFGRHVYAVSGNAEAARRAGISLPRIRLIVLGTAATLASGRRDGGVAPVSVNQASGGGDELLSAIAAAVIDRTSLSAGAAPPGRPCWARW